MKNRTIFTRDNLEVLRGMDGETADLVYLDPPFNSKRDYAAPVGSKAAGAAFKDTWSLNDTKEEWHGLIAEEHPRLYKVIEGAGAAGGRGDKAYLIYMSMRLLELRRILRAGGSIYYHCDPTMSHGVKLVMDAVFGRANFRNEIVWGYTGPSNTKRYFPRKHDCLLFYVKDRGSGYYFDGEAVRREYVKLETGETGGIFKSAATLDAGGKIPEDWWTEKRDGMSPVGRLKRERVGYPTQKPISLLQRIIAASSPRGGMVLDPFCGCATTCIAAEKLGRQWIGIDISPKAAELVKERLLNEADIAPARGGGMLLPKGYVIHRDDIPRRRGAAKRSPPRQIKQFLFGKQEGQCGGCLQTFEYRHFHIDHIVPTAKGGQDIDENKQLLCGHCNILKSDRDMAHLKARLRELKITR